MLEPFIDLIGKESIHERRLEVMNRMKILFELSIKIS